MYLNKLLPATLIVMCAFLVSVAVAAPVSNDQPASTNPIRTTLQDDLTLRSSLSPALLPASAFHQKTCHCSCGFPCNQNDDCGPGGVCEQFISCCERGASTPSLRSLSSSRAGEAQPVNVKCK